MNLPSTMKFPSPCGRGQGRGGRSRRSSLPPPQPSPQRGRELSLGQGPYTGPDAEHAAFHEPRSDSYPLSPCGRGLGRGVAASHQRRSEILSLPLLALTCLALAIVSFTAAAAPHRPTGVDGPFFPPSTPSTIAPAATTGAALQEQALVRLKQSFDAADTTHAGALTVEQARHAGLAFIADHFDEIDTDHQRRVSFQDVCRYLKKRPR